MHPLSKLPNANAPPKSGKPLAETPRTHLTIFNVGEASSPIMVKSESSCFESKGRYLKIPPLAVQIGHEERAAVELCRRPSGFALTK